jgi:hypothetical protein
MVRHRLRKERNKIRRKNVNKILCIRSECSERRKIVGHIYNDIGLYSSYSYYPLAWLRLIFSPFLFLFDLVCHEQEFHLRKHVVVTYFSGYIVQEGEVFKTVWHPSPIRTQRTWANLYRGTWKKFFPSYKRRADHSWTCTEEGDGVVYLPISRVLEELNGLHEVTMTREEFLNFTHQDEKHFQCSEYIKYTGM